jgi:hypothetical protein
MARLSSVGKQGMHKKHWVLVQKRLPGGTRLVLNRREMFTRFHRRISGVAHR